LNFLPPIVGDPPQISNANNPVDAICPFQSSADHLTLSTARCGLPHQEKELMSSGTATLSRAAVIYPYILEQEDKF